MNCWELENNIEIHRESFLLEPGKVVYKPNENKKDL